MDLIPFAVYLADAQPEIDRLSAAVGCSGSLAPNYGVARVWIERAEAEIQRLRNEVAQLKTTQRRLVATACRIAGFNCEECDAPLSHVDALERCGRLLCDDCVDAAEAEAAAEAAIMGTDEPLIFEVPFAHAG